MTSGRAHSYDAARIDAIELLLNEAMKGDARRDIYFDRHGEGVIRELIGYLRHAGPLGGDKLAEAQRYVGAVAHACTRMGIDFHRLHAHVCDVLIEADKNSQPPATPSPIEKEKPCS